MKNTETLTFSDELQQVYDDNKIHRKRLSIIAKRAANPKITAQYPHTYIYSVPGLGKTYTVRQAIEKSGLEAAVVSGNSSMFAFGVSLAYLNYTNRNSDEPMIVLVDDSDTIFKTTENINVIKNILEGFKCFHYEKHIKSLIQQLPEDLKQAVEYHTADNQIGFKVPTDKMIFIFTSNERLPYDDEVVVGQGRSQHLNAIRSRVRPFDFDLNKDEQWAWVADCALTENCCGDVPQEIIIEGLTFIYENWAYMKTKSIRTIQMMCQEYELDPDDYKMIWEMEYINHNTKRLAKNRYNK